MMTDFRGVVIEVGDTVAYCGRQDLKASLNEAVVVRIIYGLEAAPVVRTRLLVQPTGRTSSPLGRVSRRPVWLTVLRKVVVVKKRNHE